MGNSLFQKLSETELNNYISGIDFALEFHLKWLSKLNRALICQTETDFKETKNILTRDNHFNRWYNSIHEPELIRIPAFLSLPEIHTQMVLLSRDLLLMASEKKVIDCIEYDKFIDLASRFRKLMNTVKSKVKSDLKLIAKLMGNIFENADEGVMITDSRGIILSVNNAFVKTTQYSEDEVIGNKPSILHSGFQDIDFYQRMWSILLRDQHWQGKIWNKRKNNENYPEWLSITAVLDENNIVSHYIGIFSDLSTEGARDKRLYHLAHYDNLCDLPNRMLFYDRLRQTVSHSKRSDQKIAVMFMDIDGFKYINDEHGHHIGDELLQQISKRVVATLRESDTIARVGGDEFTLIIPNVENKESVAKIANKILSTINEPYTLHGVRFNISASIGISLYPENSGDINELVKQADIAMYQAKKEGKDRYKFFNGLTK